MNVNNEIIKPLILDSKSFKYILYSGIDIDKNTINNEFEKMEFNEDIAIFPKKKATELNLTIIKNKGINKILYMGNPVYYVKDFNNPIPHNTLKIILFNGKLHSNKYEPNYTENNPVNNPSNYKTDSSLVLDILKKNKNDSTHHHKNNDSNINIKNNEYFEVVEKIKTEREKIETNTMVEINDVEIEHKDEIHDYNVLNDESKNIIS